MFHYTNFFDFRQVFFIKNTDLICIQRDDRCKCLKLVFVQLYFRTFNLKLVENQFLQKTTLPDFSERVGKIVNG